MSPLPPWVDLILFPLALASLFGYGFFLSNLLASCFRPVDSESPFDWGGEVEKLAVAYGLGFGFVSLSMLGLGGLGWLYRPVLGSVLAIGLCLFLSLFEGRSLARLWDELKPQGGIEKFLFGFLTLYFTFRFLGCLVPGWGYDEAMYHLTIPRQFLLAHRIHPTPNLIQANFPLNSQMAFLFLLGLGGEALCHLFQWAQYLVLGAIVVRWARSLEDRAGYLAFLVYCSSTLGVYFRAPEEVHSDVALTVYFAISMLVLARILPRDRKVGVALVGIFNGLAWGTKYTAFVFTTPLLLAYLFFKLREQRERWGTVGGALSVSLILSFLVFTPWMARGYVFTANPVYPLLETTFPSPPPYDALTDRLRDYEAYSNFYAQVPALTEGGPLSSLARIAWAALRSLKSDKTAWPFQNGDYLLLLNLVLPFLGLALGGPEVRRLAGTALVGNLLYLLVFGMHLSRFYSVVYPLAAVLFATLLRRASTLIGRPRALALAVSAFAILHLCHWQIRWMALQDWWGTPCLTQASQRRFLMKRYAGKKEAEKDQGGWEKAVGDLTPPDASILGHGIRFPLQSPRRVYYIGDFEEELLMRLARERDSPEGVADSLKTQGFTHLLLRKAAPIPPFLTEEWLGKHSERTWEDDQFELRKFHPKSS